MEVEDMVVKAVHKILINLTTTKVAYPMKFSREDRNKGKGVDRDIAAIKVAVTAPDLAVAVITEGQGG